MTPNARARFEPVAWWFTRERIGRGLRERHQVPTELPPNLFALVRKLAALERSSPRSRTLVGKLDAIEGKYLSRYAPPVETPPARPRSRRCSSGIGPGKNWPDDSGHPLLPLSETNHRRSCTLSCSTAAANSRARASSLAGLRSYRALTHRHPSTIGCDFLSPC